MFIITVIISFLWARGIDKIPKDYKGEEFLNWDRKNDNWDKKSESEDEF
jgi:hypothetical protein